jgi:putative addiction module component (TIGR02574 family)
MSIAIEDYRKLSIEERIQLVDDIWDSIEEDMPPLELTEEDKAELRRRADAHYADPASSEPWEQVRERIFHSSG